MWISCDRLALTVLLFALPFVWWHEPEVHGAPMRENSAMIPAGTVIPIRLDKPISVKDAKRGQAIEAKIAQAVPLPDGEKIPFRATIKGSILSVETDTDGS